MRIPAGLLLIAGSGLSVLPVFGLWMLPLGLFLLAEDVPPLRRARARLLDRIAAHRPHWFAENDDTSRTEPRSSSSAIRLRPHRSGQEGPTRPPLASSARRAMETRHDELR